jgi:predicted nucleotidyltransferase
MDQERRSWVVSQLAKRGIDWAELKMKNQEIVLFGSWAVGAETPSADMDLFCVGQSLRKKTALLDLVCYPSSVVTGERWLGSELANHIASFGVWLCGESTWRTRTFVSGRSLAYKRVLIRGRMTGTQRLWRSLGDEYRVKHVVKLRRDIQRLALMKAGRPVEPSPWLDRRWVVSGASAEALEALMRESGEKTLLAASELRVIAPYLGRSDWRTEVRAA